MNKVKYLFLLTITVISFGCRVQRQSKFTSHPIKPGMTKESAVRIYGKPYKSSLYIDKSQISHDDLYYKEQLFLGRWFEINSILHFENSQFKSLEQGKESLLYKDSQVVVK